MVQSNKFSAWIEIEGVPTKEYNVEIAEHEGGVPVVTCWIASEEAKTFSVHFKDVSCSADTWWRLSADGLPIPGPILGPKRKGRPSEVTGTIKDVPVSSTETSPLVFSKITTTDDDAYMHSAIDPKFGEITLSAWSTRLGRYLKGESRTETTSAAPRLGGPVHETSKKIGGHCVSFGKPVQVKRTPGIKNSRPATHYLERVERLVSFSFKYRPLGTTLALLPFYFTSIRGKALLQANGIAPPPPTVEPASMISRRSPESGGQSTNAHPVDTEEVDLLRQQLQLIQKRLDEIDKPRGVKREPDTADHKANKRRKRVKTEGQVPIFIPGEVIDLT
ncbi:hypothetical protein PC9H_009351 [Pleurotus ostreatus]|uniref:DUF7918 domain-containing protein n=1 Tax=Pleurotus ostreatus TaxID=5322 RepID=A0A8H6ZLJ8_PLEOS|nr:uncharacterized protein PC9H_009351 [Pleurotus ostreatus]KAF7424050.1 hypothetical protein PC9H_009351 [Pleurotus ostreatus]